MEQVSLSKNHSLVRDRLITHQTTNSEAVVQFEIGKMERVHWLLGLRQAELIIEQRQNALQYEQQLRRNSERRNRAKQRKLKWVQRLAWLGLGFFLPIEDWIEDLQDQIALAEQEKGQVAPYVRDCEMELRTAQKERDRITREHTLDLDCSFDELQAQYSAEAMDRGHALFLASRIWAHQHQLPESVGQLVFDLSPENREQVLQIEGHLRLGVDISEAVAYAGQVLSGLTPQQQKQVLIQAAHLVMESQEAHSTPHLAATHDHQE